MSARDEILHLMHRYCTTIDTGDFKGLADLFVHANWTVEGTEARVGRAIGKLEDEVLIYDDGTPRTKHFMSGVDLQVEGDTARAESYLTVFQQTDDFPLQAIFVGHYFDDFERVDGAWRFKNRLIRHHLVGDMSAHLKTPTNIVAGS
jgi:hypothetical protein